MVMPKTSHNMESTPKILRTRAPIHSKQDLTHPGQLWTHPHVARTFRTVLVGGQENVCK